MTDVWARHGLDPANLNVTTTAGSEFHAALSAKLAYLILARFGMDVEVAAEKWCSLLGNTTPTAEFEKLAMVGKDIMLWEDRVRANLLPGIY